MILFFSVLFILLGINAIMMLFSLNSVKQNSEKSSKGTINSVASKIHATDSITSKFKKAV